MTGSEWVDCRHASGLSWTLLRSSQEQYCVQIQIAPVGLAFGSREPIFVGGRIFADAAYSTLLLSPALSSVSATTYELQHARIFLYAARFSIFNAAFPQHKLNFSVVSYQFLVHIVIYSDLPHHHMHDIVLCVCFSIHLAILIF